MRKRFGTSLLIAAAFCVGTLASIPSRAQTSDQVITFTARLTQSGTPISGLMDLTFEVHDQPSGMTAAIWSETITNVQVQNGLLTVRLGEQRALGNVFATSVDRFVAVKTTTGVEIVSPRVKITAVPYALNTAAGGVRTINGVPPNASYDFAIGAGSSGGLVLTPAVNGLQVDTAGYLAQSALEARYVNATGDTVSGNLNVSGGVNASSVNASSVSGGNVSGSWQGNTIDVGHGGTGLTQFTQGQMFYAVSSNQLAAVAPGANGQVLTWRNGAPTWEAPQGTGGTLRTYMEFVPNQSVARTLNLGFRPKLVIASGLFGAGMMAAATIDAQGTVQQMHFGFDTSGSGGSHWINGELFAFFDSHCTIGNVTNTSLELRFNGTGGNQFAGWILVIGEQ